jgi:hypothetical protein
MRPVHRAISALLSLALLCAFAPAVRAQSGDDLDASRGLGKALTF